VRSISFLIPSLIISALSASAQISSVPRPIIVRVIDSATHEPIADAQIAAVKSRKAQPTSRAGTLNLEIPATGDTLRVRRLGYFPISVSTDAFPRGRSVVTIGLVPIPQTLPDVTVDARMGAILTDVGFFERRNRLQGFFIDPTQMNQLHPSRTSDLFERAPGARLLTAGSGGRDVRFTRANNCAPSVYIDGVLLLSEPTVNVAAHPRTGTRPTNEGDLDIFGMQSEGIDEIGVRQIAAIEAYPTGIHAPPPYNTRASCGVILLWTWSNVNR
jgi:hypothetical protein